MVVTMVVFPATLVGSFWCWGLDRLLLLLLLLLLGVDVLVLGFCGCDGEMVVRVVRVVLVAAGVAFENLLPLMMWL